MNSYQDPVGALSYLDFLNSENGKFQQQLLFGEISKALPGAPDTCLLDAACGSGWLAGKLKPLYCRVYACDNSGSLIDYARAFYPDVEFSHADILAELPYPNGFFDVIILNMAAPDLSNLTEAFGRLAAKLKRPGKLILTVPNPSLTYPAAVWKRGLWEYLFRKKPKLKLAGHKKPAARIEREFCGNKIASHYYTLDDYIQAAGQNGLNLEKTIELKSPTDNKSFCLEYQMHRYPLILLLEFSKQ